MTDEEYGSNYRQMPPISKRLKVSEGTNTPERVRQSDVTTNRVALGKVPNYPRKHC